MTHLFEASCLQKVLESFQRAPESQSPFHPAGICKESRQYRCEFARLVREQVLSTRPLLFCELIGRSCSAHTHKLIVWTSTLRSIRVWWQKSLNSFNQLSNRIIGEFGMLREGQPWTCILPRTLAASMCWPHLHPRNQAYGKRRLSELGANDTLGRTPGW